MVEGNKFVDDKEVNKWKEEKESDVVETIYE
jgi:hypothetical protein